MQSDLREAIAIEIRKIVSTHRVNPDIPWEDCGPMIRGRWIDVADRILALLPLQSLGDSPDSGARELEAARAACTRYKGYLPTVIAELESDLRIAEEGAGSPKGSDALRDVLKKACAVVYDWREESRDEAKFAKLLEALEDACVAALPDGTPVEAPGDSLRESEEPGALELLHEAAEQLIWCSGSGDFGPGGQAELGWKRGPAGWLEKYKAFCAAPQTAKPSRSREAAEGSKSPPAPSLVEAAREAVNDLRSLRDYAESLASHPDYNLDDGPFITNEHIVKTIDKALSTLPVPQAAGREWLVTGINIGTGQWSVEGPPIGPNKFRVREVVESPAPEKFPICPNCTTPDLTVRHIAPVTNCPNAPEKGSAEA